jgi:hypothetical protein
MPDSPDRSGSGDPAPEEFQPEELQPEEFHFHLELTPPQLKITHTALKSLLDDFGRDQHDVHTIIHEVLGKLPDEHSIRAIRLDELHGPGE